MASRLLFCLVRFIRVFLGFVSRLWFSVIYRGVPHKPLPPITNLLLLESATALAAKIRDRKVTSEEVVHAFIKRIHEINPILNCVVDECFDEAISKAKEVDLQLKNNPSDKDAIGKQTPFLGVPFTAKDCFKVKGLRQTAGLYCRRNFVAEDDADAVRLMREAGGIMLCVTNVSELCMWWESSNTIYGTSRNPYDTNRIVGGSSGGEGCLQSACGSPIGIGSDIGGSIRMPSFFNGIFGHKPSTGIVSNSGQEPVAVGVLLRMLGTGPMSRHASDLRPALKVMAAGNNALLKLNIKVPTPQLRVLWCRDDGGSAFTTPVCAELQAAQRAVVSHLQLAHGVTARQVELKELLSIVPMYLDMLGSEKEAATFSQEMVLKQGSLNLWWEVPKYLIGRSKHTAAGLFLCFIEKFTSHSEAIKPELVAKVDTLKAKLKELLGDDGVLLFPSHPTLAPYHSQPLSMPFNFAYTAVFNMMGFPVTQVPLGLSRERLPLGIQVVANLNQDHLCLSMAEELERAFGGWVCPSVIE